MRGKRTVRRPTRWTPDEWRRVEDFAEALNVPSARFIREAVLAAVEDGTRPTRPRVRDELVHQLTTRALPQEVYGAGDEASSPRRRTSCRCCSEFISIAADGRVPSATGPALRPSG
jgi:hypothetical protein